MFEWDRFEYIAKLQSEKKHTFWAGIEVEKSREILTRKEAPDEEDFFESAVVIPYDPFMGKKIIQGTEEKTLREGKVKFLAPASPEKIVAVGLNYRDHAEELNMKIPDEPIIFIKPPSALNHHDGEIVYPEMSNQVDYEAELAVVIARSFKGASREDILCDPYRYILGFTCFNDVTARDLQRKDGQWARAKSFDTFAPTGPWLYKGFSLRENFKIQCFLNGKEVQNSTTEKFIFDIAYLLSFISQIMTLKAGDIVSTGTPPGVGPMKKGDTVEVRISKIGTLRNKVV